MVGFCAVIDFRRCPSVLADRNDNPPPSPGGSSLTDGVLCRHRSKWKPKDVDGGIPSGCKKLLGESQKCDEDGPRRLQGTVDKCHKPIPYPSGPRIRYTTKRKRRRGSVGQCSPLGAGYTLAALGHWMPIAQSRCRVLSGRRPQHQFD